jgi:hypothetical protein
MAAYNSNSNASFKKRTLFKLVTDDKKHSPPTFIESVKDDKGAYVDGQSFDTLQGFLTDLAVESYTDKRGKEREWVKFYMTDDTDAEKELVLSLGWNMLTRNILNCLASQDTIGLVNFSGWIQHKPEGDFDKVSVRVNGKRETSKWKYMLDEMPKPTEVEFKGEVMRDYSPADEFFKNVVKIDIVPKLTHQIDAEIPAESPVLKAEPNSEPILAPNQFADDLPF